MYLHKMRVTDLNVKYREGIMPVVNCRDSNICILCKYWIGAEPESDYFTSMIKYQVTNGLCKIGKPGQNCRSDGLCRKFEKNILYM